MLAEIKVKAVPFSEIGSSRGMARLFVLASDLERSNELGFRDIPVLMPVGEKPGYPKGEYNAVDFLSGKQRTILPNQLIVLLKEHARM